MSATERTEQGQQILISGVSPITDRDRLQLRMNLSLFPRCQQRPLNFGLFDEHARNQLDLFQPSNK